MPPSFDADRVPRLLEQDVARTLGGHHLEMVRVHVANVHMLALAWMKPDEDGNATSVAHAQASFDQKVVDDVQQAFHDTWVDTTWPSCPRHPNHPLSFHDDAWWCEADNMPIAKLGELGASHQKDESHRA